MGCFWKPKKVLETIQKHQPDAVFASSEYYKIMIESILASLDDKSSMTARKTRMTIAVDKLIELEVRSNRVISVLPGILSNLKFFVD